MDQQDIRTLKILEEIDKDQTPSQRDMARKLNISLGLVNSFIKRLVHKGYFKITHIPANRVRYILTPKGMTEKTRLTYAYIRYSFDFYKVARQKLRMIISEFVKQGGQRIIIWGVTDLAEIAYVSLQEFPVQLIGVVDGKSADGEMFRVPIIAKEKLSAVHFDKILITDIVSVEEAIYEIRSLGISKKQLLLFE
jgi:DNA-binding MarR family transcriptional regulator